MDRRCAVRAPFGDERGFVHKRLFKAAKGFLTSGPIGAVGGFLAPQTTTVARSPFGLQASGLLVRSSAEGALPCPAGFFKLPNGDCQQSAFQRAPAPPMRGINIPGPRRFDPFSVVRGIFPPDVTARADVFGEARVGRFGAGLEPVSIDRMFLRCPTGSVLGKQEADGSFLCYNRRDISNKERKWPRGRRPLLTGGDMRAISTAASAARKLQAKQKQLQELGLLKKPAPRKAAPKQLAAGHHAHVAHD